MVKPTRPASNGFVALMRMVYNPLGFSKGYNFVLCTRCDQHSSAAFQLTLSSLHQYWLPLRLHLSEVHCFIIAGYTIPIR